MPNPLFTVTSQSGIRRDGTELDSPYYADGVWVRWQRSKPRKMGGYQAISQTVPGPVRNLSVDQRNGVISAHYFSQWGVQRQQVSFSGAGGSVDDRTPAGFTPNPLLNWSYDYMYSNTGGKYVALLAAATPDVQDLTSDVGGGVYTGDASSSGVLTPVADGSGPLSVSGGLCVLQPFLVVFGSNGLIRNSNPNDFSAATGWAVGGANFSNQANVSGTKIVRGTPVRGGSASPAGLFWSLDSLIRMTFTGASPNYWQYDTLSCPTSLLSKNSIVEVDGTFFWLGMDRFLTYAGTVQELPNQLNQNWFFDNLNYAQRNKVWGTKITRWGEVWWFYPRGNATECTDAIIFNYREGTWYDARLMRSAGDAIQSFRFPVWVGEEDTEKSTLLTIGVNVALTAQTNSGVAVLTVASNAGVANGMHISGDPGVPTGATVLSSTATSITMSANATANIPSGAVLNFTSMGTPFVVNNTVTGGTSGAKGTVVRVSGVGLNLTGVTGTFVNGEALTGGAGATATVQSTPLTQQLDTVYAQEFGTDKVVGQNVSAVYSSFTTQNFGFANGTPFGGSVQPFGNAQQTADMMTRITRLEPDFNQVGPLTVQVEGRSFAQDANSVLKAYTLEPTDSFINMREQERIMRLTVISDTLGGHYEMGQTMVALEPGDERSTKTT